jgi:hypothetical protein
MGRHLGRNRGFSAAGEKLSVVRLSSRRSLKSEINTGEWAFVFFQVLRLGKDSNVAKNALEGVEL